MRITGVLAVLLAASVADAQDRARPREGSERERPPERAQPAPQPQPQPPPPQAAPAPPPRQEQGEAEERHARPRRERDGAEVPFGLEPEQRRPRPGRERPEPPRQEYGPRGNDGLTDAERRHPRPDPDRHWRERRHGWRDYPDYPWWYGRNDWYWFPYSYGYGWYDDDRYLDGSLLRPHRRYWSDDGTDFYWPFDAPPRFGCHWYWVPTGRDTDRYGPFRHRRYRYYGWRLVYLCVDGRPYPW